MQKPVADPLDLSKTPDGAPAKSPSLATRYRWWICALLFLATTINYMDRQIIGVLKPTLQKELGWSEDNYGTIVFWFQVAYAAGYLLSGRLMDLVGVRFGYALCVVVWSVAAALHGVANTVRGFSMARFGLGIAEGGNFPAAIKTVSEWFPRKERAFATGLFNAGSNIGAIMTPLIVPWITYHYGWRFAFFITGASGVVWLVLWLLTYRRPEEHPRVSPEELAYIRSDPPDHTAPMSWASLLRYRATWAFAIGMAWTSPVWWFYLFWVPGFLHDKYDLDLKTMGPPLVVIYLISDAGSILGGWFSSMLIKRGWTVSAARKTAMFAAALFAVPVFIAPLTNHLWVATLVIGLAAAAHQGFSANLYTLVSDTMPRRAVSSVVGIGGMAASIVAMFNAKLIGHVLEVTGNYLVLFGIASCAYLLALLAIHLLLPKLDPLPPTDALRVTSV